jgi:predicted transcriptional regulator
MGSLAITDTFKAISDDKSLIMFNTIALSSGNTDILMGRLGLTTKQYYSRMSGLVKAGLIMRKNSKNYSLTSFGKVVYEAQMLVGKGIQNYWKLEAIDLLKMSTTTNLDLTTEECEKIVHTLIENDNIKNILLDYDSNSTILVKNEKTNNNNESIISAAPSL